MGLEETLMKVSYPKPQLRHLMILSLCAAMIGLVGVQVSAGANPPPPSEDPAARIDKRMAEMTETLSLTETQQAKIRVIMVNMTEELQDLRDSAGEGNRPDREQMKALRDGYDEQIEAELTPEQRPLFRQMLEKGKHKKQNSHGGGKRKGHGQKR
jgi:Spy/CpxP family protein refolding chaperone